MTRSVVYGPSVTLDAGNNKWTNLADGVAADDAATVGQLGSGGGSGGGSIDRVVRTTDLTLTASSAATAQTWITGNATAFDGSTAILLETFCFYQNATAAAEVILELYDGSTDLGRIAIADYTGSLYGAVIFTPSAATKTYSIRGWRTGSNRELDSANGSVVSAFGSFYRITLA